MGKSIRLKRLLAAFVALIFTLLPMHANAAPKEIEAPKKVNSTILLANDPLFKSEDKIEKKVKDELKKKDIIEVMVELNEKVNVEKVAKDSEKALKKNATSNEKKNAARNAVVKELKDTAQRTQKGIIDYLQKEKDKGSVMDFTSYYIVNMVYVKADNKVIDNLSKRYEVKKIYLNNKVEIDLENVEPLENAVEASVLPENIEWNVKRVGADRVWDEFNITGTGVVVGIIDTGVQWDHSALKTKWRGYNPVNPTVPNSAGNWFDAVNGQTVPYDIDIKPHGSHVTGTICGQEPDGTNAVGVAPGIQWIMAKAFELSGGYDNWLLAAGQWMLAPNGDPNLAPDIINNSWGGAGFDEWYRDMVRAWRAANILPVFAAGNENDLPEALDGSIENPGNYPESFAVAATDSNNLKASFSQMGPSPYEGDIKPDISAPGVSIRSSVPTNDYQPGWSGTSMATPAVSGSAALILSANESLSIDDLEQIITGTATPLTDSKYTQSPNYGYGYGLVNAYEAVAQVASGVGTIQGRVTASTGEPVNAVITVLETGRSVRTNPLDGTYSMHHVASKEGETFTLKVEAYGYYSTEGTITLSAQQVTTRDFALEKTPVGSIEGYVNDKTGAPIEGVEVKAVEALWTPAVLTDSNGYYKLENIPMGTYRVRASKQDYYPQEVEVVIQGNDILTASFELAQFLQFGFDDGTCEDASITPMDGAWFMKVNPTELTRVDGVNAYIWDGWQYSQGSTIIAGIAKISFTTDPNLPSWDIDVIHQSAPMTIESSGWNYIDLSQFNYSTTEEFYVFIKQLKGYPYDYAIGVDQSSKNNGAYYMYTQDPYYGGYVLMQLKPEDGNIMIRAVLDKKINTATLTEPAQDIVTVEDTVNVSGTVIKDTPINIYVNGQLRETVQSVNNTFTTTLTLAEGNNIVTAACQSTTGQGPESNPINIIRDTIAPKLDITSPVDGTVTRNYTISVDGIVDDFTKTTVKINGKIIGEAEYMTFSSNLELHDGENIIIIEATDLAGHTTVVTRRVTRSNLQVPPAVRPDTTDNALYKQIDLGYTYDSTTNLWRLAITDITVDGVSIKGNYTIGMGVIIIKAPAFTTAKDYEITIKATGYVDAKVIQTIKEGTPSAPAKLTPDSTDNYVGNPIDITFYDWATWKNAITDVTVDGISIKGRYTIGTGKITINGDVFTEAKDYNIAVKAFGFSDALVTQPIIAKELLPSPVLSVDITENYVGNPIDITFADDAAWRSAITDITVDGISISGRYVINEGMIAINGDVFTAAKSYNIVVKATGYTDAIAAQEINELALLTPPILTADTKSNNVGKEIEIKFTDDGTWRNSITEILVNGVSIGGNYSFGKKGNSIIINANAFTNAGTYEIVIKATGYTDAIATQEIRGVAPLTSPILTADTKSNNVGEEIEIKITDDGIWRNSITEILVNGVSIDGNYSFGKKEDSIIINANVFTNEGTYEIVVKATGYDDVKVTQEIIPAKGKK